MAGLLGAVLFGLYFGVPTLYPRLEALVYSARPATSQVVAVGAAFRSLVTVGTWLQATGAALCVVFFLGLLSLAPRPPDGLADQVVRVGSAVLVALVLVEGVFTLTWVSAAQAGVPGSARAGYDLMSHFIQVFPIVPAPMVYLPLGWILVRQTLLPRWLGRVAIGLGAAFAVVGLLEVFMPFAQAFAAGLAGLQDLWVLTAAAVLLCRPLGVDLVKGATLNSAATLDPGKEPNPLR